MLYLMIWMLIGLLLAAAVTYLIAPDKPHAITVIFTTFLWPIALVAIGYGLRRKLKELDE